MTEGFAIVPDSYDVAIIGGGIIGVCAAAFLAEAGLRVVLFEREAIAAGASGRNLGAIQHPFDGALAELYHRSLAMYRELDDTDFQLGPEPAGLLLLGDGHGRGQQPLPRRWRTTSRI